MPTSLNDVAFYVFALFPGIAFFFAREGHKAPVRRSVIRETGAILLVSTLCDGVLIVIVSFIASVNKDLRHGLLRIIDGHMSWPRENPFLAVVIVAASVLFVTVVGHALGSEWADKLGLGRFWKSWIPRDMSAWAIYFDTDQAPDLKGVPHYVDIEALLKSGRRIRGTVNHFENDPAEGANSALILGGAISAAEPGSEQFAALDTKFLMLRLGDVQTLGVNYEPSPPEETKRWRWRLWRKPRD